MIRAFSLALAEPLATANGTIGERTGFLFERDGGVGEATPLAGWTEPHDACVAALRAADDADSWERALDACMDAPAARHAVSLARMDADARAAGRPLASALSDGAVADSVPVNATVGDGTAAATSAAVADAAADGFDTVKVKVGSRSVRADLDRLRAASDAAPAGLSLRADANGAWDLDAARQAADACGSLPIEYIEQPLAPTRLDATRSIDGVPIALDEALHQHPLDAALAVADYVVLKPMVLGGIDRARDAARTARQAGVEPVVSTTIDGVVARTAAVHLAASIPDVPACGLATADRLADALAPDPAPVVGGRIQVPADPGHGVEVTADA
ncbi:mandelate racemase/muconate lactonizing enzyme family protein [Halobacterium salinarum]|uniref:mandelate racemase/muconate lactonizing enzyme family protein n=1 Tax=Halobacterium salinarum TaxID=2242 RepID=UPI0025535EC4|nr:enolase C-terminal domain-like protein [Halobacterium salinarum]MDL0134718.1 enolase C-terminal domain-like protein [Halobacterium salinarum]